MIILLRYIHIYILYIIYIVIYLFVFLGRIEMHGKISLKSDGTLESCEDN
jgi:hypothetical protein